MGIKYYEDPILGKGRALVDNGGGGVEVMTHDERVSIIPAVGDLIYDTSDHNLYVGDGMTVGGIAVSGGTVPEFLVLGEWTDEDEDIYVVGDWTR